MEKQIKHLKTLLVAEQFVVTGSYTLELYGLDIKAKDLDIILVNPTEESLNILQRLQQDSPAKTKPKDDKSFFFVLDEIKIDVFVKDKKRDTLCVDGIEYSKILPIVEAKHAYRRLKDIVQLRKIAKMFFEQKEVLDFLDNSEKKIKSKDYGQ